MNERLTAQGKLPVKLTKAPEELDDEDLLEMANAGLVDTLVVDNHKAWFWQRVWPALKVYPTVALRTGGEIAWAIRKDSPKLGCVDGFLSTRPRFADAHDLPSIPDQHPGRQRRVGAAGATRFTTLIALFRKYGAQYNIDWMLMAAQGYQESRLDQNARSHVGAIGVMQVMPDTGKS